MNKCGHTVDEMRCGDVHANGAPSRVVSRLVATRRMVVPGHVMSVVLWRGAATATRYTPRATAESSVNAPSCAATSATQRRAMRRTSAHPVPPLVRMRAPILAAGPSVRSPVPCAQSRVSPAVQMAGSRTCRRVTRCVACHVPDHCAVSRVTRSCRAAIHVPHCAENSVLTQRGVHAVPGPPVKRGEGGGDVRLLRLDCGHVFTVETLDEATGLKHYFNLETGEPVDLSAIPPTASSTQPRCPSVDKPCTATISGPTRYRRPVALARLGLAQRKWKVQQGHKLAAWRVEVVNVLRELTVDKGGRMLEALLTKQRLAISRVVSGSLDAVKTAYETSPTQDVFGKLTAQQARTGDGTRAMLHVRAGPDSAVLAAASTLRLRVTHLQIIQRLVTSQAAHAPRQGKAILQCVKKVCAPTLRVLQTLADLKAATSCALLADELVAFADTTLRLVDGAALPGKEAVRLREVLGSQLADHIVEVSPATDVAALRVADRPRLISDEERLLILKALEEDVGSGLGSFGGHWYACSCGYEYAIGECGGALETIACPECGAVIGGENHHLADGNVQAADMLRVAGLEAS
eukprot:CAMPEP_0170751064 /NCGR_PEP_ID=MMETSP0437-20130122/11256_1 /TAXON_ID=0 /ORGANISM="Sexangularia sp." /LENGTH=577 /DNA_ID=CAMNT_0011090083 /DNA_START=413 /DNA_END=2145 /DNA_ORIENTATION=-